MRVRLSARTRIADGGRLLVGGSPLTVQRLRRAVTEVDADTTLGRRWLATGLGSPVLDDVEPVPAADLTVVVPAHGRPDAVARCLAGLDPLAVVVVDDASDPPLAGATVTLGVNAGPAGARNAGLARVRTPYVALVDSDVQVAAADLLALTRHLADPHVALVAPRVRGRSTHARWWERYDAAHSALDLGPHPAPVRPGSEVSYLPSACLVARTAVLRDEAGGFDEELRVGEDVDLVWRLVAAGHGIRYDPDVVVTHDTRPTVGAWLRQSFGYGSSAAPLAARHGSAVAPAVLRPGLGLAAAA
ncbi:glycosyltransferase, partial [Nocardioides sp.]|uniref:glycosyltransferase n=1 Tax=Nocardioides sp. TaxID=35761 RepID=UPI00271724E1